MDQFPPLDTFDSDSLNINFDDYLNFPECNPFSSGPAVHNASLDAEPYTLDNPGGPYPHNSSNFELDGFDQTLGLSFIAPSLDYTSVATHRFEDFEEVDALLDPCDHFPLPVRNDQQKLIQMPWPFQVPESPNCRVVVPNNGEDNMIQLAASSDISHVGAHSDSSPTGLVSPSTHPPSHEQGVISIQSEHMGAHGMKVGPLYNEYFNFGPSYIANSGGQRDAAMPNPAVAKAPFATECADAAPKCPKICLRCQWLCCKEKQFDSRDSLSDHWGVHYAALISEATNDGILCCRWHGCSANRSGKAFLSFAVLRKHLAGHVKKYWCLDSKCALSFARKSDLARHNVHIHSDDRSYLCPVIACERGYKRKDKLDEHLRKDHDHWGCPFDHCTAQVLGANRESHLATIHSGQDPVLGDKSYDEVYECGFPSCEATTSRFTFTNACRHLRSCHFVDIDAADIADAAKDFGPIPSRDMAFVLTTATYTGEVYHCRVCPRTKSTQTQLEPRLRNDATYKTLSSMKLNLRPF